MTPKGTAAADRSVQDALASLLAPTVEAAGYDLEDLEVAQAGRRRRIRLSIDKDGGVTLDECAEVSRLVDAALEETDGAGPLGDEPYVLEVSSPGTSRPLTLRRHWRRNTGRLVAVATRTGERFTGRVREADDEAAVLEVDGERRRVAYAEIATARVQVELSRPDESDEPDEPGPPDQDGED
jgi:ribosome maturation factor RimP